MQRLELEKESVELKQLPFHIWIEENKSLLMGLYGFLVALNLLYYYSGLDIHSHITSVIAFSFGIFILMLPKKKYEKVSTVLEDNNENSKYFIHSGFAVHKHLNNIAKTSKKENMIEPLLLSMKQHSTHSIIAGTTGSGKTVYAQHYMREILRSGSGFIFVDGKGSKLMQRTIFALTCLYGREQDFHLIDFSDPNNSQAISFFNMKEEKVKESFKAMLDTGGQSDDWMKKALNLMDALLFLLMKLKALNLIIHYNDLEPIAERVEAKLKSIEAEKEYAELEQMKIDYIEKYKADRNGATPPAADATLKGINDAITKLNFNPEDQKFDYTLEQFLKDFRYKKDLDFSILGSYLNLDSLIKTVKFFHYMYEKEEFIQFVETNLKFENIEKEKRPVLHFPLLDLMVKQTHATKKQILYKTMDELPELVKDFEYVTGVATDYWSIINGLINDFGNTINSSTPEVDIQDIIFQGKIIYFIIPGTVTPVSKKIFSSLLMGQITAAYEKLKDGKLAIPYTIFMDEANSWTENLVGLANFLSQSREQQLGFVVMFQTTLEKMDDGKLIEHNQLMGNANNKYLMKMDDEKFIEGIAKSIGKKKVLRQKRSYVQRDFKENDNTSLEKDLEYVELDKLEISDFKKKHNGEMDYIVGDQVIKAVAGFSETYMYEPLSINTKEYPIPVVKKFPKNRYLIEMGII